MDRLSLGEPNNTNGNSAEGHGSMYETPRLVHQSNKTAIYRHQNVGIKVFLGPGPMEEKTLRLVHEQNISNFLPSCCHKRKVLRVDNFDGCPALYFKWCNGVTLSQWLQNFQAGQQGDWDIHVGLRAAVAIAKTLDEFHENGIVYNSLAPENIVLDTFEGDYIATFIDLSGSVLLDGESLSSSHDSIAKTAKENDLRNLGNVLNQLFRGERALGEDDVVQRRSIGSLDSDIVENEGNAEDDERGRKRGKQQLRGEGLPRYLASLISTLVLTWDGRSSPSALYSSARDVFFDLKIMSENPGRYLGKSNWDESTLQGRLRLKNDLFYGRQVQMAMLMHLFQSMIAAGNPLMALVSGSAGAGKSSLVNQLKKCTGQTVKGKVRFVGGKFSKSARPDTVLMSAMNTFFGEIINSTERNMCMSTRWKIHDAIGSGNKPLMDAIPNLRKLMVESTDENSSSDGNENVGGIGSSHRLKFIMCKLIGAIASRSNPLLLFLDDLQWADEMTLDVIRMIMADPDISHILFLGCYRENEVTPSHPLLLKLTDIQEQGTHFATIKVGPIEKDCVNSLISDTLCLPPSLCKPLSTIVHSKTGGVILFVQQFLTSLNEEGLLWFSMTSGRWEYDLNAIRSKEISEDVVKHMTQQMFRLPKRVQMGLKIASCLGSSFDKDVIIKAKVGDDFDMVSVLESCVDGGYLQNIGTSKYVWAHDQVQQAAHELIPLSNRESFHLLLGSRLFINTNPQEMDRLIFFIVDNMNRGLHLIQSTDQKYEASELFLQAGEKAISKSAFGSAAEYFTTGLSLLGSDCWETHYNLTMKLYDAASEALFVTGDFSRLKALIEKPLFHARCDEDKLNIYNNLVRALAASGQLSEAIAKCVFVLSQLGEDIPRNVTQDVYHVEAACIGELLRGKNHNDLLSLPLMEDKNKLAAMQFLNHALSLTYIVEPNLNPIVVFRMVKMSINYGVCNLSAFAFGCYGAWLVSALNSDFDGGYKMGRVATALMKRLAAVDVIPRLYTVIYTFINIWKEPFQASLSKHLEAFNAGSTTGDTEYAVANLFQYSTMAVYGCGERLEGLAKNITSYVKRAIQCKQVINSKCLVILLQLTLDLMGVKENSFSLYFDGMTEDSAFASALENNEKVICRSILMKQKCTAFWLGDLDTAAQMYERMQEYPAGSNGRMVSLVVGTFIDGLIALYFARKHRDDEEKWKAIGDSVLESVREWSMSSSWNFMNKKLLLEAEHYFLIGDDDNAILSYEASVKAARDHRFIHEEGLAHEKAAAYYVHTDRHQKALESFIHAKRCYEAWGAHAIVHRVEKSIAVLLPMLSGT